MLGLQHDLDADRKRRQELLEGVAGLRCILTDAMESSRERLRLQLEEEKAVREGRIESVKRGIEAMLDGANGYHPEGNTATLCIEEEKEEEELQEADPVPDRAALLKQRALLLIASRGGGLPKVKTPPRTETRTEMPPGCAIQTPPPPEPSPSPRCRLSPSPTKRRPSPAARTASPAKPSPSPTEVEIVRSTQSNGEKERERYRAALQALRKEAEEKQSVREKRKKELLRKAQDRIEKFCVEKGFPHSKEARSEAALKRATQRHRQLAEEREKEEIATRLREEYLARCKEEDRRLHLQEISENLRARKRPSPKKGKVRTGSVQRKQTPTPPPSSSPVWRNTATPESSFDDVRRITVNLFDSIVSEPTDPTSPTRAGATS